MKRLKTLAKLLAIAIMAFAGTAYGVDSCRTIFAAERTSRAASTSSSVQHRDARDFEAALEKAFQTPFLMTVTGVKPISIINRNDGVNFEAFIGGLEALKARGEFSNSELGWVFSRGYDSPHVPRGSFDWVIVYNRQALKNLLQDPEAVMNLLRAGVEAPLSVNKIVSFLEHHFADRTRRPQPSAKDHIILGTLLGFPPSDAARFAIGDTDQGRPVDVSLQGPTGEMFYPVYFKTYLPETSERITKLRGQARLSFDWYWRERAKGRTPLRILLGR